MKPTFLQRGGLWVLAQGILLLTVLSGGLLWPTERHSLIRTWGGGLLLLAAAVIGLAGAAALGRNLTPFPQPTSATRLVQSGIYGWMRHPLYTSVTCLALGWALLRGSWPAVMASVALGLFFDAKARREERWLRQQFPEYAQYAQKVKRFVPGIY